MEQTKVTFNIAAPAADSGSQERLITSAQQQAAAAKPTVAGPVGYATISYNRWAKDADLEAKKQEHHAKKTSWTGTLGLAYAAVGVVFGDIGTSPLYTYSSTFSGWVNAVPTEGEILGAASLIVWTLTIGAVLKYLLVVLYMDDNGEGGTFALYSLICRYAGIAPSYTSSNNSPLSSDNDLSTYTTTAPLPGNSLYAGRGKIATRLTAWLKTSPWARSALLSLVLTMTSMVMGDGVLTPAQSVLGAIYGLQVKKPEVTTDVIVGVSVAIIVLIFAGQRFGTGRVGFTFAPIVISWFACNVGIAGYNIATYYPGIFKVLSPHYGYYFFQGHAKEGFIHLAGIFLAITGSEAMYADLGHLSRRAVQIAFLGLAYPALIITYIGQAAWLIKHPDQVGNTFYACIPGGNGLFWFVFVIATSAACVASQAMITGVFSIVKQSMALGCFPRVTLIHTSTKVSGQIYIPEVNWLLMVLTIIVVACFKTTTQLGNAYGVAVSSMMLGTTWLTFVAKLLVNETPLWAAVPAVLFFSFFDLVYISTNLNKVPHGGWFALAVSAGVALFSHLWHWGSALKHRSIDPPTAAMTDVIFVKDKHLSNPATQRPIIRLPGVAVLYSEAIMGVPTLIPELLKKLGALHSTIIIVTIRPIAVPHVTDEERILFAPVEEYPGFYRCIARYGYLDTVQQDATFVTKLVQKVMAIDPESDAGEHAENPVYITLRPNLVPRPGSGLVRRQLMGMWNTIARIISTPSQEWRIPAPSLMEINTVVEA